MSQNSNNSMLIDYLDEQENNDEMDENEQQNGIEEEKKEQRIGYRYVFVVYVLYILICFVLY